MKLWKIYLISLVSLVGCATTQTYTYEIIRPVAGANDILQVCGTETGGDNVYLLDEKEECPDGTTLRGTFFSVGFSRDLLDYLDSLEIRVGVSP